MASSQNRGEENTHRDRSLAVFFKDPNSEIEEERWKLIKDRIISKGGVVVAEHLAQFLDPLQGKGIHEEAYMFPVLVKFQGRPVMDDQSGHVLYHFESLKGAIGGGRSLFFLSNGRRVPDGKCLEEKKWELTSIRDLCWILVHIVGFGLVGGWAYIAVESESPAGFVKFFTTVIPLLPIAAVLSLLVLEGGSFYFMVCLFYPIMKNFGVYRRNRARQHAALALQSPSEQLRIKLQRHALVWKEF
ncbi:PREDICTED: uncharacterized protein At5g03900, chloroplastic-like [Fragaria vesca subsp. vesca]